MGALVWQSRIPACLHVIVFCLQASTAIQNVDVHLLDLQEMPTSDGVSILDHTGAAPMSTKELGKALANTAASEFAYAQQESVQNVDELLAQAASLNEKVSKAAAKKAQKKAARKAMDQALEGMPRTPSIHDVTEQLRLAGTDRSLSKIRAEAWKIMKTGMGSIPAASAHKLKKLTSLDKHHLGEDLTQPEDPLAGANAVAAQQAQQTGQSAILDASIARTQSLVNEINDLAAEAERDRLKANEAPPDTPAQTGYAPSGLSLRAKLKSMFRPVNPDSSKCECVKYSNCTNVTLAQNNNCRDWWYAGMPAGEDTARAEANARQAELMKLIAESRVAEAKADQDQNDDLQGILDEEKFRQDRLMNETKMNTSENGWWDLPRYQPKEQEDHNVTVGYEPPPPPKDWLAIYGPNATSHYDNATGEMRIAYDDEGYPKPWDNVNNTELTLKAYGVNTSEDRTAQSMETLQSRYDRDLAKLDFSSDEEVTLRESRHDSPRELSDDENDSMIDVKELLPKHFSLPTGMLSNKNDATGTTLADDQDMAALLGANVKIHISPTLHG